jgi:lipopolysaccharide/colanic/teichoic acid biosynthesis glycosyltransferase
MVITGLLTLLRRLARPCGGVALEGLLPPDRFRAILERERTRADRTGDRLSLLAFTPRVHEVNFKTLNYLVRVLRQRLRCTDDYGWLNARQIAVLLPATPVTGAWRVADDICLRFPDHLPPPLCTVYSYPSDDNRTANGTGDERMLPHGTPGNALALESLFLQPMPRWKRAVDIVGAATGLVLLLPVLVAVALVVKATSPGPVLFRQWRSGRGGKPFVMYKFRSMVVGAESRRGALLAWNEQDGPAFKIRNDPRVTGVGSFLRKTSLDELPQLWNIIRGEMSLVGPRPLPCAESRACAGWLRRRLDVTPGLTCIWQVCGRSAVPFVEWVRMDLQYIRGRSLVQDLKLLFKTVPAVILGRGAH